MLHLLAMITARPGKRDDVLASFNANALTVRAEDGCIEYAAAVDVDGFDGITTPLGPDSFVVIEKWASAEALRAHMKTPHMAAYALKTKDMLDRRLLHILAPA